VFAFASNNKSAEKKTRNTNATLTLFKFCCKNFDNDLVEILVEGLNEIEGLQTIGPG